MWANLLSMKKPWMNDQNYKGKKNYVIFYYNFMKEKNIFLLFLIVFNKAFLKGC